MSKGSSQLIEAINKSIETKFESSNNSGLLKTFSHYKKNIRLIKEEVLQRANNCDTLNALEQRVHVLEDQNEKLLFFIHYLYDNFPELVKKITQFTKSNENAFEFPSNCNQHTPSLTRRENEVLGLMKKGLCAKEIAGILFISETTVITHKRNLKEKFNARNSVELISKASSVKYFSL
ncbi:MAG: helix-turn-helix transcriptional regulator [Chitinophagaceae bacterium]|nr:helix-turn-helix transcriptional regulator [Chitinophagaceae bacterium]